MHYLLCEISGLARTFGSDHGAGLVYEPNELTLAR